MKKRIDEYMNVKLWLIYSSIEYWEECLLIKKYTCQNGVRIVVEHIPTVRSAAIGVWIKTGSRNEIT